MKSLLAFLFVTTLSSGATFANTWYYDNVNRTSAPSSDQSIAGSSQPNAQEIIDTTSTGQAAPMRMIELEGRCRDYKGTWLFKEDVGYNTCVRDSKGEY